MKGGTEKMGQKKQPILRLKENQVHAGMIVMLCLEGKAEPEKDEKGNLLVLVALSGGVKKRKVRLYDIKEGIQLILSDIEVPVNLCDFHGPKKRVKGTALLSYPMEGFNANVRFQPINVYTPEDAPSDEHFIAFVGAERLRQKNGGYLWLYKNARGIILDDSNGSKTKGQEYSLPKDALLTSIDEWQKFNKGEQAAA